MVKTIHVGERELYFSPPLIESIILNPKTEKALEILENGRYMYHPEAAIALWDGLLNVMTTPGRERLALYIPLSVYESLGPFGDKKREFRKIWKHLLNVEDVRENFHFGDIFEPDARPSHDLERVVKIAHLTPWLLKSEIITVRDVIEAMQSHHWNELVLRGFSETWDYIEDKGIADQEEMRILRSFTEHLGKRIPPRPLYVSQARRAWLAEMMKLRGATPRAKLEGPFSPNLTEKDLASIAKTIEPDQVFLIGGSRLKGYATKDSDYDVFDYAALKRDPRFFVGSVHAAHIYNCYAWLAGEDMRKLALITSNARDVYRGMPDTENIQRLERLESDLLLYRLLHKGYARSTGMLTCDTSGYREMDGDCPFYDDGYRKIATALYLKYVV